MTFERRTLRETVVLSGVGLHTGQPVTLRVHPGDRGIFFRLGAERVEARPANVTDTTRSTRLGSIGTVEHLMSAFCGLEITDAEVELDAPEVPGVDGSSLPFVSLLLEAGLEEIGAAAVPALFRRVFFHDEQVKISAAKGEGHWRFTFDTGARWPGVQTAEYIDVVGSYRGDVAPSRTTVFTEELPMVRQLGLGKGLDESSVLVLGPDGYVNEARSDLEPARHKLLDLMGDLYLSGLPARSLSVSAERSGHRTNVRMASLLVAETTHG